jgi:Fanconi-associated nuclease 1
MVLKSQSKSQSLTLHNAMLGRRIPHPASTKFDDLSPPAKRLKTRESTDREGSHDVSEEESAPHTPRSFRDEIPDSEDSDGSENEDEASIPQRLTELESALPSVKTDKEAIEEYEAMRASDEVPEDLKDRLSERKWTRGKSSIYVDAFNLALETVLEDEGHLFDEKEMEVFNQWRELEYEVQYL